MKEDFYRYVLHRFMHKSFTCFTSGFSLNATFFGLTKSPFNKCIYLCFLCRQSLTLILVYIIIKGKFVPPLMLSISSSQCSQHSKQTSVCSLKCHYMWALSGWRACLLYISFVQHTLHATLVLHSSALLRVVCTAKTII